MSGASGTSWTYGWVFIVAKLRQKPSSEAQDRRSNPNPRRTRRSESSWPCSCSASWSSRRLLPSHCAPPVAPAPRRKKIHSASLREVERKNSGLLPEKEEEQEDELKKWEEVGICSSYTGLHLPTPLTQEAIQDLISSFNQDQPPLLHRKYCLAILRQAGDVLRAEPNITRIPAPSPEHAVTVVGDLHGSLADLARVLELGGWPGEGHTYVFNGDFVDRGDFGVEVPRRCAHASGALTWGPVGRC
jgi:hypothetical protein